MSDAVKPIRPEDVPAKKAAVIPPEVVAAFNELIAEKMSGGYAKIMQVEAVEQILRKYATDPSTKLADVKRRIFDEHWLDVEEIYRTAGWHVEYDKPGYNEDYGAFFVFRAK